MTISGSSSGPQVDGSRLPKAGKIGNPTGHMYIEIYTNYNIKNRSKKKKKKKKIKKKKKKKK
jgi:hypothetical protein